MSDAFWGVDFGVIEARSSGPLAIGRYRFEVDKCEASVNVNGKGFVGIWCKVVANLTEGIDADQGKNRTVYEQRYLTDKALPYTKGFFEEIGAADALETRPSDAEGAMFEADIAHKSEKDDGGNINIRVQFRDIQAFDVDDGAEETEEEEKPKEAPARGNRRKKG